MACLSARQPRRRLPGALQLRDGIARPNRSKRAHGDRPAIWSDVDGEPHATTYGELLTLVNRSAHVLVDEMGLQPGNRVLLRGPNTLQMAVAALAALKAGLVRGAHHAAAARERTQADHR